MRPRAASVACADLAMVDEADVTERASSPAEKYGPSDVDAVPAETVIERTQCLEASRTVRAALRLDEEAGRNVRLELSSAWLVADAAGDAELAVARERACERGKRIRRERDIRVDLDDDCDVVRDFGHRTLDESSDSATSPRTVVVRFVRDVDEREPLGNRGGGGRGCVVAAVANDPPSTRELLLRCDRRGESLQADGVRVHGGDHGISGVAHTCPLRTVGIVRTSIRRSVNALWRAT